MTFGISQMAYVRLRYSALMDISACPYNTTIKRQKESYAMNKSIHGWLATLLIISTLLLAFPVTALADGDGHGNEKEVDGYHVKLIFAEPAQVGENQFHIQVTDPMGMPVTGAEVEVAAMPVEGMAEMDMATEEPSIGVMTSNNSMNMVSETPEAGVMKPNKSTDEHSADSITVVLDAAQESGEYMGKVAFKHSGEWMFNVHFTVNGETKAVEFPFDVARPLGLNYGILAGFIGINAVVITSAAVLKKRKTIK
jgi:hypothetical protein